MHKFSPLTTVDLGSILGLSTMSEMSLLILAPPCFEGFSLSFITNTIINYYPCDQVVGMLLPAPSLKTVIFWQVCHSRYLNSFLKMSLFH